MTPVLAHEPIPLRLDADRVLRVGGTRVPLESVVALFEQGETPEEITQNFPVLRLDDVYAVLTYVLRHRAEIGEYIERRGREGAASRAETAKIPGQGDLRKKLLAMRPGPPSRG